MLQPPDGKVPMATLAERMEQLPQERRRRVEERARVLIAEEMRRREARERERP